MSKLLTDAQDKFLRKNARNISNQEVTDLMNIKFKLSLKLKQIKAYKKNHKISSGLTGHFEKGHIPQNKGQKYPGKKNRTTFQKGNRPHNYLPIGTERVNGDDYIDVKMADPNQWVGKHILIWEKAHGKKPKGTVVIFADRNNRNFDLENLVLVQRDELLIANKKALITESTEITKVGLNLVKLYKQINKRKREKK